MKKGKGGDQDAYVWMATYGYLRKGAVAVDGIKFQARRNSSILPRYSKAQCLISQAQRHDTRPMGQRAGFVLDEVVLVVGKPRGSKTVAHVVLLYT